MLDVVGLVKALPLNVCSSFSDAFRGCRGVGIFPMFPSLS